MDIAFNQAITAHQEGWFKEVEQLYRSILKNQLMNLIVRNNLGEVLQNLGGFDEAGASFRKPMELKPDCAEAPFNLGNLLIDLNSLDQATKNMKKGAGVRF